MTLPKANNFKNLFKIVRRTTPVELRTQGGPHNKHPWSAAPNRTTQVTTTTSVSGQANVMLSQFDNGPRGYGSTQAYRPGRGSRTEIHGRSLKSPPTPKT